MPSVEQEREARPSAEAHCWVSIFKRVEGIPTGERHHLDPSYTAKLEGAFHGFFQAEINQGDMEWMETVASSDVRGPSVRNEPT